MYRLALTTWRGRWAALALTLVSFVGLFVVTSGAQAVVVNDHGTVAGVALVPQNVGGNRVPGNDTNMLSNAGVSAVTTSGPCTDPWLSSDFFLPNSGLCWHAGGSVIHANETFAMTWSAPTAASQHSYWSGTTGYVEQFLRDVASASGALGSPYALTTQYQDGSGRAGNTSIFGGGCIDNGSVGGATCTFGGTAAGHDFPSGSCAPTESSSLGVSSEADTVCVTDAQVQSELAAMISQTGIQGRTQPGYTPLVTLFTPPGVEVCIDAGGSLCSVDSASSGGAPAQFCSYHSQVNVGGANVSYVVVPWTPFTACDEPDAPALTPPVTPQKLSIAGGLRLVSPLSQGELAAVTNPGLNGWFALDGSEINDNGGCVSEGQNVDQVNVGPSSQNPYLLQHEFNNGGAISSDPYTYFGCAPVVDLIPNFVVPSAVNQGDIVALDGSSTGSTLLVPNAGYQWDFGDGSHASGPSVEHSYSKGGTYTITLTVTDRGGNQQSLSQTIVVLGANGQPVSNGTAQPGQQGGTGPNAGPLQVRIQLMPEGLRQVLASGITVRVSANERANGFAYVSVPRAIARRMHLHGRGLEVTIGEGTVSEVQHGTVSLHLHLSKSIVARLKRLHRVTFDVALQLVGPAGDHVTIAAAGRY